MSQGIVTLEDVETWQEHPRPANRADPVDRADPAGAGLTSVRFAEAARRIGSAAAALGLTAPVFRSPPKRPGMSRSITRRPDGSATVSVTIRGRPAVAVVADMIDGVLAANEPGSTRSPAVRDRLWSAATPCLAASPGRSDPAGAGAGRGRAPSPSRSSSLSRRREPARPAEADRRGGGAGRWAA